MKRVLIIKLGYSETLDPEIGKYTSLGDVLRTTVILPCFKNDDVTWLTDEKAYPLLKNNEYINRVLFYDMTTCWQLQEEIFDVLINLEKVPGICALSNRITALDRYGFRYDPRIGKISAHIHSQEAFDIYTDFDFKRLANKLWQEVLYGMIGRKWKGEEYILNYEPQKEIYDVGLNYMVGHKWPSKAWAKNNWDALFHNLYKKGFAVNYQQGASNLDEYIKWIGSCRLIVTTDSLGLHLAIAMEKPVVVLFGPTMPDEVHLYGNGTKIIADIKCESQPCLLPKCSNGEPCMEAITVEQVVNAIRGLLNC